MPTSNSKLYSVKESGGFTREVTSPKYVALPEKTFDSLEAFINVTSEIREKDEVEFFSLLQRRQVGKIIIAKNYVGFIIMTDGTVVEILPKLSEDEYSISEVKKMFLEILEDTNDITFNDPNLSEAQYQKLNLFEFYITLFLNEVVSLVESRLDFLPDSEENIPEKRLIKATLRFILLLSSDMQNRLQATRLLRNFEDVPYSVNYSEDFSKSILNSNTNDYKIIIKWCKVILKGNCFTSYSGSNVAVALLFPVQEILKISL